MKSKNALCGLMSGLLMLAAGTQAHAAVVTPGGLNAGDQFRIVFVTSGTHDGVSGTASDYDTFVTNSAVAAGLDTYNGLPVTWQLLGSTRTVDAISRLPASSPALYRVDGAQVATSGTDFWDGTIANPINVAEDGTTLNVTVFTGTDPSGIRPHNASRYFTFGPTSQNNLYTGSSSATDLTWTAFGGGDKNELHNVYAFSSIMVAVPEPASALSLAGTGLLLLSRRRRR